MRMKIIWVPCPICGADLECLDLRHAVYRGCFLQAHKMSEMGQTAKNRKSFRWMPAGGSVQRSARSLRMELLELTHSIPEMQADCHHHPKRRRHAYRRLEIR